MDNLNFQERSSVLSCEFRALSCKLLLMPTGSMSKILNN